MPKRYVDVQCIMVHRTKGAICVLIGEDDDEEQVWVPIQATTNGEDFTVEQHATEKITLSVEEGFAKSHNMD